MVSAARRILGIDPGLTRCGVGVVDIETNRVARYVFAGVIRTDKDMPLERRLQAIAEGIDAILDEYRPNAVAVERVFAQHNTRTVMATAQASGIALQRAAARALSVGLHTPSEVKAAVTGYGGADKRQVTTMVTRILSLATAPKPADAADALALALCHGWRSGQSTLPSQTGALTPAQSAWLAAERQVNPTR